MAELLTQNYSFTNAKKILELFSSATDSVYMFVGKVSTWPDAGPPEVVVLSLIHI